MRLVVVAALSIASLAAAAPPDRNAGERAFGQCTACHALEPGRSTPAGPTLHRVVGRPVASLAGFNYSPALRRFAAANRNWTPALLDRFLADPEGLVPGNEMGFPGIRDAARRRALIAWLTARPQRRD